MTANAADKNMLFWSFGQNLFNKYLEHKNKLIKEIYYQIIIEEFNQLIISFEKVSYLLILLSIQNIYTFTIRLLQFQSHS